MRGLPPEHTAWDLRESRGRIAAADHAPVPHPAPAEIFFDIGLTVAVALGIALAGNLLAGAVGC